MGLLISFTPLDFEPLRKEGHRYPVCLSFVMNVFPRVGRNENQVNDQDTSSVTCGFHMDYSLNVKTVLSVLELFGGESTISSEKAPKVSDGCYFSSAI